jgi:hypothetical protein
VRLLRALLLVLVGLATVVGAVLLLQSRDDAEVGGEAAGPGEQIADSCPSRTERIARDRRRLSDAQLRTALSQGNVVIRYAVRPTPELRRLQRDVAGPFDAEIAAAGQAVILDAGGEPTELEARAWGRRMTVGPGEAAQLQDFTEAWLGKGAPEPCE